MNRFWRVAQSVERLPVKEVVVGSIPTAPAIDRRRFLAGLLASPILLPAVKYFLPPVGGWPVGFSTADMRFKYTERFSTGFTDWRGIYGTSGDGVAIASRAYSMSVAAFRAAVLPGLNKIWSEEYDKHSDEWEEIFREDKQLTLFDSINPDSLEEIEIELQPAADALRRISLLPEKERVAAADARRVLGGDRERESGILLPRIFGFGKGSSG
jgi:hypothetical protein